MSTTKPSLFSSVLFPLFLLSLLTSPINATPHLPNAAHLIRRASTTGLNSPNLPQQSGTISSCNKWYDVVPGDTCASVETTFGITHIQFLAWNPAVSSDCGTNFWAGDSYCVGIGQGVPTHSSTTTTGLTSRRAVTSQDKPTMTGTVNTCNKWYDIVDGDTCSVVTAAFGISLAQFLAWNPAVSSDCSQNFWTGEAYCVGTGTVTMLPPTSVSSTFKNTQVTTPSGTYSIRNPITSYPLTTTTINTAWPPEKTQAGQPSYCINWYLVLPGDTCDTIRAQYSTTITLANLLEWNPALGSDCSGLYVHWFVCVGIQMQTSYINNSTFTTDIPTTYIPFTPSPLPEINSTFIASPTQTGISSSCQAYYQAQSSDSCTSIISYFGYITADQFLAWNPAVRSDCSGLLPGDYYCVANFGSSALPLPPTVKTLPSPVQSGIASNCVSWYQSTPGDDCDMIPTMFGTFSKTDFLGWNPSLDSSCSGILIGDYYCVGVAGTPTTRTGALPTTTSYPSNGAGPQPEQIGIPSNCNSYWLVGINDNCTAIATANDITVTDFYTWNPAVGSGCSGLLANYYVCVGTSIGATTTATGAAPTATATSTPSPATTTAPARSTPSPIQPGTSSSCTRYYFVRPGDSCYDISTTASIALSDFYTWNPAVHVDCSGLQAGVYVCIGTTGPGTTISSGPPVGPATIAAAAATPVPVQSGMVANCLRFYYVESGDGCYNIATSAGIALNSFYTWNPAVKGDCTGLQASVYVCIGIAGPGTTITSGPPVPT